MQIKKLASALAFTAVAVNMIASVALAQTSEPVTGTQNLDCDPLANTFGTLRGEEPNNFQIGDDGTRAVSSSNDVAYVEANNSAYFDQTTANTFTDTTDTLNISSNTPYSCASESRDVQLTVSATNFVNGSSEGLLTYGSDGAASATQAIPDGSDPTNDYYAMLSVITSANTACTSPCVLAGTLGETNGGIKHGEQNVFANVGPNDNSLPSGPTGFVAASNLIAQDGSLNTVTLYHSLSGLEGTVTVPGLDYNLSMVANPEFTGAFTSTVTYTLS